MTTKDQKCVFPGQPDGIEDESRDLPDPVSAAERIIAYVEAFGDGLYDAVDGQPLYGRDLCSVAEAVKELSRQRDQLRAQAQRMNIPMTDRLRQCASDTSSNWDRKITIHPPEARQLLDLIDTAIQGTDPGHADLELSPWQDPDDGFPKDAYFDAVIVALEKAGVGVHDSFRNEDSEFAIVLYRGAYQDGPVAPAHDVLVGWRVDEESDPAHLGDDESWYGWHGSGLEPGWFWMRRKPSGEGINPAFLPHPESAASPMDPLEEPDVIAAAVAALVRGKPKEADR